MNVCEKFREKVFDSFGFGFGVWSIEVEEVGGGFCCIGSFFEDFEYYFGSVVWGLLKI